MLSTKYIFRYLKHQDYEILVHKIQKCFPNEEKSIYYIPPVPKNYSKFNKSKLARGKLVDKFRNSIFKYRDPRMTWF